MRAWMGSPAFSLLGVLVSNQIACWGQGSFGQLGDGTTTPMTATPVLVLGLP